MGFFSFKTQDTNKSIANYHSRRKTFKVYMLDDKGNVWEEDCYGGYGMFGGKDYYELVAEMNGLGSNRDKGINLFYHEEKQKYKFPNLVKNIKKWKYTPEPPEDCEYQGYFY
jgi:hypothetical protein